MISRMVRPQTATEARLPIFARSAPGKETVTRGMEAAEFIISSVVQVFKLTFIMPSYDVSVKNKRICLRCSTNRNGLVLLNTWERVVFLAALQWYSSWLCWKRKQIPLREKERLISNSRQAL